jgi:hypothetical protein
MYFPYMRAKRNELLALRELAEEIKEAKCLKPILEPVKESPNDIVNAALVFENHGLEFICVANPVVGDLVNKDRTKKDILEAIKSCAEGMEYGVIVDSEATAAGLESLLSDMGDRKVHFIHNSRVPDDIDLDVICKKFGVNDHYLHEENLGKKYIASIKGIGETYLINDPFNKMSRNEDYCLEEFFSDAHSIYDEEGYSGYGDFLTVGNFYDKSGFRPKTVAIHLTHLRDDEIWIKHFKSYTRDEPGGEEELFMDALEKLVDFINNNKEVLEYSTSAQEFLKLYNEEHYPGLGYIKKISMKHHMELMLHVLGRN